MSDLLKAVEEAAHRLAKAKAKKKVLQNSMNGIIAEQEKRAAAKKTQQSQATGTTAPTPTLPPPCKADCPPAWQ